MGKKKAYKKGVKDTVKLLMPFFNLNVDNDNICYDLDNVIFDNDSEPWCDMHCNGFNEKCVYKWLELKKMESE